MGFSALQRAENFSIRTPRLIRSFSIRNVSVLFSEPKISQSSFGSETYWPIIEFQCSSASRKFLNASDTVYHWPVCKFQCSSASRKFLNSGLGRQRLNERESFSALQRAENFSMVAVPTDRSCIVGFSALQRAENFSIARKLPQQTNQLDVSVLFSEPKISQFKRRRVVY